MLHAILVMSIAGISICVSVATALEIEALLSLRPAARNLVDNFSSV
jgi:hypothetical protein